MDARNTMQQGDSKKGEKKYKGVNLTRLSYAQLVALAQYNDRKIKTQLEVLIRNAPELELALEQAQEQAQ